MCDWKTLRAQLAASKFLEKGDDLNSQRGIIATATAIMDRMANGEKLRHVSWQPVRIAAKAAPAPAPAPAPASNDKPSSVLVAAPVQPVKPMPPARVRKPVDAFAIEG